MFRSSEVSESDVFRRADYRERPNQIRRIPNTASIAPRVIQGRWSIMKLDAGQWIQPAPCPTHSNPISSAAMPPKNASDFIPARMSAFPMLRNGSLGTVTRPHLEPTHRWAKVCCAEVAYQRNASAACRPCATQRVNKELIGRVGSLNGGDHFGPC